MHHGRARVHPGGLALRRRRAWAREKMPAFPSRLTTCNWAPRRVASRRIAATREASCSEFIIAEVEVAQLRRGTGTEQRVSYEANCNEYEGGTRHRRAMCPVNQRPYAPLAFVDWLSLRSQVSRSEKPIRTSDSASAAADKCEGQGETRCYST